MNIEYLILPFAAVLLAMLWAFINIMQVLSVKKTQLRTESFQELKGGKEDEEDTFMNLNKMAIVAMIGEKISRGTSAYLRQAYIGMFVFALLLGVIVLVVVDFFGSGEGFQPRFYSFIAFMVGSVTSMICGWVSMAIAVQANFRTLYQAT